MHALARSAAAVLVGTLSVVGTGTVVEAQEVAPGGVRAAFEGRVINLAEGWGEATACAVAATEVRCYRSEAEMDLASGPRPQRTGAARPSGMAYCSSALRLYEHTGYGGRVLTVTLRGVWMDLGGYRLGDQVSSYRVGGCASVFREHSHGGGLSYPGSTLSWTSASSMVAGWNDRISSIYVS